MSLPERVTLNGRLVDRRVFLGALGITAVGTALVLARGGSEAVQGAASREGMRASALPAGDWHVDDMWGHWPRYAHPIPYTLVRHVPISWDAVAPIDRVFVT
jgi:hypothetical protein